jgi:hypothetical protein
MSLAWEIIIPGGKKRRSSLGMIISDASPMPPNPSDMFRELGMILSNASHIPSHCERGRGRVTRGGVPRRPRDAAIRSIEVSGPQKLTPRKDRGFRRAMQNGNGRDLFALGTDEVGRCGIIVFPMNSISWKIPLVFKLGVTIAIYLVATLAKRPVFLACGS